MSVDKPNKSDEIDLGSIFEMLLNGVSSFFRSVLRVILVIRKTTLSYKWLFLVLGFLLCGFVGTKSYFFEEEFYRSALILRSSNFQGRLIDNSIAKLNVLAEDENYEEMARALHISVEDAKLIVGFDANPFVDDDERMGMEILRTKLEDQGDNMQEINELFYKFQVNNESLYRVVAMVKNNSVLEKLDSGIYYYFADKPFIKRRMYIDRENLKKDRAMLYEQLAELDTIKQIFTETVIESTEALKTGSNNIILADDGVKSPIPVLSQELEITNRIRNIDRELFLSKRLEVIDTFAPSDEPANDSTILVTLLAGLVAIGISYVIIILLETNKWLARKAKEQNL